MLAQDPDERFQSAADIVRALGGATPVSGAASSVRHQQFIIGPICASHQACTAASSGSAQEQEVVRRASCRAWRAIVPAICRRSAAVAPGSAKPAPLPATASASSSRAGQPEGSPAQRAR